MTAASSAVPSDGGCDSVPPSSSPSTNVRRRGVSSIAGASSPRVPFVDRTFITSRSVGLCTRGVGSLSDDAALPGIHGDILYASRDSHSSSTSPSSSRDGSAVLAATDADDIVVAPTGDPNEPIAPVATANDIVTASSSAALSSAHRRRRGKRTSGSLPNRPPCASEKPIAPRDPPPRVRRPRRARRYSHPSAPGRDPRGRAASSRRSPRRPEWIPPRRRVRRGMTAVTDRRGGPTRSWRRRSRR